MTGERMRLLQRGLIFKVLQRCDSAMIPGTASAQSSGEAPAAESSNSGAVCWCDYENSNQRLTGGLSEVTPAVGHISGIGDGDVGRRF
jgi:hypothetical protein